MLEKPYAGRASITDNFNGIEIVVPAIKNWFVIPFLCAWLGGWAIGLFSAGKMILLPNTPTVALLFIFFWLIAWTFGGVFFIFSLIWSLKGKEIITVGNGMLTIEKKGAPFLKARSYDLREINNMGIKQDPLMAYRRMSIQSPYMKKGTISFDYGFKTVRFGEALDEAEARHIIELLKNKKLIY